MHLTSLPGPFGSGDLGPASLRFASWLAKAGQSWWQMLPVVPPSGGASPYQSTSAFAGNPYLISLEGLREVGLIGDNDLRHIGGDPSKADFGRSNELRDWALRSAYESFSQRSGDGGEFARFCEREASWLRDYALFCALKVRHQNASWVHWPAEIRRRQHEALDAVEHELAAEVRFHKFVQFAFARQWAALRAHCEGLGIGLIGDIPIFVAHDSADVWAHQSLFFLRDDGEPTVVAGVPPDYFSATGQRWGNALYDWEAHRRENFSWWVARFQSILDKFHAVRVDHFIGFHRYWAIKSECPTAIEGEYHPAPGADLFAVVEKALGKIPVIAEDLGVVTPEVKALRDRFGFPGMRVLQFAFGTDVEARNYQPHSFPRNSVVYTGTHDNDTTRGWFDEVSRKAAAGDEQARREHDFVLRYVGTDGRDIVWDLIRLAWMSTADTAIIPLQDLFSLDTHSRMNLPGTIEHNWLWRVEDGAVTDGAAARLRELTETYARTRI